MCVNDCFHWLLRDLPEFGEDLSATFDSFRDIYDDQTLGGVNHNGVTECIANSHVDIICYLDNKQIASHRDSVTFLSR